MRARAIPAVFLCLAVAACARPGAQDGVSQLDRLVAARLPYYGIEVRPEDLTLQQSAALHLLMVSERDYFDVRRRAERILANPVFRD